MQKIRSLAMIAGASAVLAACGGGNGGNNNVVVTQDCPAVGNLEPVDIGPNQCQISGELTQDATLSANFMWFLEGRLQVGTAESNATLNIDAGTEIRGDNAGSVDHLLVFPGSALSANGTSANPVRFLSDDDNVDGTAEWGGLFLRGFNGLTNLSGTQGENRLDYVVVAEAGAEVSVTIDEQEVNYQDNIVLNGVDSSTTLTFVQSHNSARDGLHILNGDPRLSWILATGSGRDGIWYRDFTGLIKDLMVIHNRDMDGSSGRAGIYASETMAGNSNPRIVNATLVGRDNSSDVAGMNDNEFGILFADNTDQIRLANVLIANFRNGCYEADSGADLSQIDVSVPGPTYLDGVHCANEAGANPNFGIVRDGSMGFPDGVIAASNSINANGLVYYNGAVNGVTFTGEIADRSENFTASWYLNNIGGIGNGLAGDSTSLNAFLDGDTNNDRVVDSNDTNSPFIIMDDGADGFNQDVAEDTGGYDLTHIGAVRGGAITNTQFDGWTVATDSDDGFVVGINENLVGMSQCPEFLGGASVNPLERISGRNVCEISGVISTDAMLTSNIDWQLEGALQVGDETNFATLTVQSGTRITGDNVDATDYLLVFPGSAIDAQGTSARPVRFTSNDADINGSGEWGGLFIRGYNGLTTLSGTQGENSLDYVVVAEAGAPVAVTIDGQMVNYQDNLVVNGVDRTSTFTFVQSHNSARDGLHILNGDPRMSWILATGSGRDGIWYRDFNGLIKDLMVIHNRDMNGSSGRSGIYASETMAGNSNPRIVNATLVGRDNSSDVAGMNDNEFGILFADNTDQIRMANVLIANFRHGCYEVDSGADLSAIDTTVPGPNYLDGIHCANEAGANPNFGIVRMGSTGFPMGTVAANNSNGDGLVYYNGAGAELANANTPFFSESGGINFTGEIMERANNFTAGWYLDNIRGIGNGLAGNANFLNGFLDGDTNRDGVVDADDTRSPFIIADDGMGGFNQDVAEDTGGYDLTHVGAVRGGAVSNTQFDNWTVGTNRSGQFTVRLTQ
ncbi:hypothetical protein [Sessilibacter corallicola]|uniref:hypothetical protein n=1 Tax=Sessilibacter corallicola TaxID=2904075 RepID=UPI001E3DF9C5|nr:hypothetical protein [Sessilibacter corallicola]MCE2030056.1 hypothetical protein [Sessilibacter corallicola]